MSKLTEVVERLKALPDKKRLRQASQSMKVYRERVEESIIRLQGAVNACRANASVLGEAGAERVMEYANKASRKSSQVLKRLAAVDQEKRIDIDAVVAAVAMKKTDTSITEIGDHSKAAAKAVKDVWQAQLEDRIAPYRQLCKVAQRLSPRTGNSLSTTLQRLENRKTAPPVTTADAATVSEGIESLKHSIDSLGLHGDAAKFLVQAVDGQADPQDLFKEEVKQFFDNDPQLWKLLRVTLS